MSQSWLILVFLLKIFFLNGNFCQYSDRNPQPVLENINVYMTKPGSIQLTVGEPSQILINERFFNQEQQQPQQIAPPQQPYQHSNPAFYSGGWFNMPPTTANNPPHIIPQNDFTQAKSKNSDIFSVNVLDSSNHHIEESLLDERGCINCTVQFSVESKNGHVKLPLMTTDNLKNIKIQLMAKDNIVTVLQHRCDILHLLQPHTSRIFSYNSIKILENSPPISSFTNLTILSSSHVTTDDLSQFYDLFIIDEKMTSSGNILLDRVPIQPTPNYIFSLRFADNRVIDQVFTSNGQSYSGNNKTLFQFRKQCHWMPENTIIEGRSLQRNSDKNGYKCLNTHNIEIEDDITSFTLSNSCSKDLLIHDNINLILPSVNKNNELVTVRTALAKRFNILIYSSSFLWKLENNNISKFKATVNWIDCKSHSNLYGSSPDTSPNSAAEETIDDTTPIKTVRLHGRYSPVDKVSIETIEDIIMFNSDINEIMKRVKKLYVKIDKHFIKQENFNLILLLGMSKHETIYDNSTITLQNFSSENFSIQSDLKQFVIIPLSPSQKSCFKYGPSFTM